MPQEVETSASLESKINKDELIGKRLIRRDITEIGGYSEATFYNRIKGKGIQSENKTYLITEDNYDILFGDGKGKNFREETQETTPENYGELAALLDKDKGVYLDEDIELPPYEENESQDFEEEIPYSGAIRMFKKELGKKRGIDLFIEVLKTRKDELSDQYEGFSRKKLRKILNEFK